MYNLSVILVMSTGIKDGSAKTDKELTMYFTLAPFFNQGKGKDMSCEMIIPVHGIRVLMTVLAMIIISTILLPWVSFFRLHFFCKN